VIAWQWAAAAIVVAVFVAFAFGVLLTGMLHRASQAVELDNVFLSRSVKPWNAKP
jgi:hypothetical protein